MGNNSYEKDVYTMKNEKPVLGYDKFLMMVLLKEGPLDLDKLWEKSMLFLSLIWYSSNQKKINH